MAFMMKMSGSDDTMIGGVKSADGVEVLGANFVGNGAAVKNMMAEACSHLSSKLCAVKEYIPAALSNDNNLAFAVSEVGNTVKSQTVGTQQNNRSNGIV